MRSGNQEELLPTEERTQPGNDTETYDAMETEVNGESEMLAPPNEEGVEMPGRKGTRC